MLSEEERVGGEGWGVPSDQVDVRGEDVSGVEEAHYAGYHAAPVAALGYYLSEWLCQTGVDLDSKVVGIPYLSYPSLSMSLWHVSAYWGRAKPFFLMPAENPKLGRDGATMWKAGACLPPLARRGNILVTSRKLPGPVMASVPVET